MKKQEVVGWVYPCEDNLGCRELKVEINGSRIIGLFLHNTFRSKSEIDKYSQVIGCSCGKGCKPIKVKVTVEEV